MPSAARRSVPEFRFARANQDAHVIQRNAGQSRLCDHITCQARKEGDWLEKEILRGLLRVCVPGQDPETIAAVATAGISVEYMNYTKEKKRILSSSFMTQPMNGNFKTMSIVIVDVTICSRCAYRRHLPSYL